MHRFVVAWCLLTSAVLGHAADPCSDPLCADEGFGASGRVTVEFGYADADRGNAVVRVPGEDRLYVIGQVATLIFGDADFGIACLLENGAPCTDFGTAGRVTVPMDFVPGGLDAAIGAAIVPWGIGRDWRLVVVGQVERATAGDTDFGVALLRPDGSRETDASGGKVAVAFDTPGTDFTDVPAAVAVTSDAKILVGGTVDVAAGDSDWGFTRLNSDLTLDTSFGTNGRAVLNVEGVAVMHGMVLQPDDKIVAVGSRDFGDNQMLIARLTADGSADISFGILGQTVFDIDFGGANDDAAWAVTRDRQGRFVIVGEASAPGSGSCWMAARALEGGQPDTTFSFGSAVEGGCVNSATNGGRAVAVLSDGTIVAAIESDSRGDHDFTITERPDAGPFSTYHVYPFDLGASNDDRPRGMLIQPDGKIVIAGRVVGLDGTLDFGVLRLWSHQVFADGFEAWGSAAEWTSVTNAP